MKRIIQLSLLTLSCFFSYCTNNTDENGLKNSSTNASSEFVGEASCVQCHQQEYNDWVGSHHDWAMKLPSKETVEGDFNRVSFHANGESYYFHKSDSGYLVDFTPDNGESGQYKIAYTFGVTPLQQYLIEFPDGKYQTLRASWNVEDSLWYNQYEGREIPPKDWLHWTQGGQRWNTMCAECHSTNLQKNYNPAKDIFSTTYSIINVSCEACHGPARAHVEWASKENPAGNPQIKASGVEQLAQMNMCAGCHARRVKLTKVMKPGENFDDQFALQTINSEYYFPDGQIKEEDYVYGSFLQSKMYHNGVTCSDCHNTHSLDLKLPGNALCMQCHTSEYNSKSHHFHKEDTEAAQCINCHMSGRTYMGNDFRRDHSFRIPRPDQSVQYGTPNACNGCHQDKSTKWATDWIVKWYGNKRADHFSDHLLKAAQYPYPEEVRAEVLDFITNLKYPAIARATALEYYPSFNSEEEIKMLLGALADSSSLVRYNALNKLQTFPVDQRAEVAVRAMQDSTRLVRTAAAWLVVELDTSQLSVSYKEAFLKANKELNEMLNANADFPLGRLRLGDYYIRKNNVPEAIRNYEMALQMDSLLSPVYGNLATAYNRQGNNNKALQILTKLIKIEPDYARGYYLRGLLYNEMGQTTRAINDLEKATVLDAQNFRYYYNLSSMYLRVGNLEEALKAIQKGLRVQPDSPEGRQLEKQIKEALK